MKNYILPIGILLFLISCGKSEKPIEPEKIHDAVAVNSKKAEIKEVETPIYALSTFYYINNRKMFLNYFNMKKEEMMILVMRKIVKSFIKLKKNLRF